MERSADAGATFHRRMCWRSWTLHMVCAGHFGVGDRVVNPSMGVAWLFDLFFRLVDSTKNLYYLSPSAGLKFGPLRLLIITFCKHSSLQSLFGLPGIIENRVFELKVWVKSYRLWATMCGYVVIWTFGRWLSQHAISTEIVGWWLVVCSIPSDFYMLSPSSSHSDPTTLNSGNIAFKNFWVLGWRGHLCGGMRNSPDAPNDRASWLSTISTSRAWCWIW